MHVRCSVKYVDEASYLLVYFKAFWLGTYSTGDWGLQSIYTIRTHTHSCEEILCNSAQIKLNFWSYLIFEILLQDLRMPDAGLSERLEVISTLGECLPRILGDFKCTEVILFKK